MLNKQNRLSTNFEFKITRKYGQKIFSPIFTLYYLKPKNYQGDTKVGVVVSNKFDKRAVLRNRAKRLIHENLKSKLDKIPNSLWLVFFPKTGILESSHETISTEVDKTIQKISIA